MSGFLYFLPNENAGLLAASENWIKARDRHGLGEVLSDVRDSRQIVAADVLRNGPDGGTGTVVSARRSDGKETESLGYFSGRQTWAKTFGSAWIGYESLPKPEWLLRLGESRSGIPTHDSFDRRWLIPVARRPGGKDLGESLPTQSRFEVGPTDQLTVTKVVRADARELWELSGRVWDTFNGEACEPLTDEQLSVVALKSLAWNYRVGPAEANAFAEAGSPIFDSDTTQRFFLSLIHWDTVSVRSIVGGSGNGSAPQGNDDPPTGLNLCPGLKGATPTGDPAEAN